VGAISYTHQAKKDNMLIKEGKIKREKPLPEITADEISSYELPENWIWIRIGDLLATFDYGTSQKSFYSPTGVPVLSMGNVVNGRLNFLNLKRLNDHKKDLPRLFLRLLFDVSIF
jgi:type I restriction enzyme S subunit